MKHKLFLASLSLHISALLYFAIAVGCLVAARQMELSSSQRAFLAFLGGACALLALGVEFVAYGVHRRRYWAWITGLCVFGLYVPSLFLPLGLLGLWGLLDRGSQEAFGIDVRPP